MKRFSLALGLFGILSAVMGCSDGSADGSEVDEGALEQERPASRYDLKSYTLIYGMVAVNDEASELYDKLPPLGQGSKERYAGLTAKEVLGERGSARVVWGIHCMKDQGSSSFGIDSNCIFTGIVKTSEIARPNADRPELLNIIVHGKVAHAMSSALPRPSAGSTTSGIGRLQCTSTSAPQPNPTCTMPVVIVGPELENLAEALADSDAKTVADIEKSIAVFE